MLPIVADAYRRFSEIIWSEKFWLPPNNSWEQLQPTEKTAYPDSRYLWLPIPLAFAVFTVRLLVEKVLWEPIGVFLNIPGKKLVHLKVNPVLEEAMLTSQKSSQDIQSLAKKCDMTERQVARYFRVRSAQAKARISQLDKFKETGFRYVEEMAEEEGHYENWTAEECLMNSLELEHLFPLRPSSFQTEKTSVVFVNNGAFHKARKSQFVMVLFFLLRGREVYSLMSHKIFKWRFTYYLGIFFYGIWTLWDKPWLWNGEDFWTDYPFQTVSGDVFWYYMMEMAFYWSLLISQFFDVKRKDFLVMFVHHVITIFLMCFSWINNSVRVGTGVLLVHDAVDFWLEGAKLAKYANKRRLSEGLFGVFALVWIVTRLFLYPYKILQFTLPCPLGDRCFPAFHLYNFLLGSLQVLHIFWTFTIFRVIYRALNTGKTEDVRSDTESSDSESAAENEVCDDEKEQLKQNHAGGDFTRPADQLIGSGSLSNGNGVHLREKYREKKAFVN